MKRLLSWLLGRDLRHSKGDPDTCPACPKPEPRPRPHIVHAPHLDECECGRTHPNGWICAASIGGRS